MMSKGYAFIQYTCQEEAVLALENMDHKKFDGRLIYVELARPGKEAFCGAPRTCGPPAPTGELLQKNDEVLE
ncbi:hypothetical protein CRG98_008405 [Punica granatum]|nr:hypothetical protein CRG98_008405 [Punica granatum]